MNQGAIRRLRRHGRVDRFGPFPLSIVVPPAEFRRRVENWADFIEVPKDGPTPRHVVRRTVSPWEAS